MPERISDTIDLLKDQGFDSSAWFDPGDWRVQALIVLLALAVLMWILRIIRRVTRRHRPPVINPLLQKYGESRPAPNEEFLAKRWAEAARIVATSSTASIVGYGIVEQIEAVFVDGFSRPEDALEGLKAAAAMKGGNAVMNVFQKCDAARRYSAHGDVVKVRHVGSPLGAAPSDALPDEPPPDAGPGRDASSSPIEQSSGDPDPAPGTIDEHGPQPAGTG